MTNLHLTVAAVIERNKRFLMIEEVVSNKNVINQPAGHVEYGESLRDAAVREVREETAWKFSPNAINGIYLWQNPNTEERFLRIVFCGTCSNHDAAQPLDTGILRTLWLSRAELVARQDCLRSPMVLSALEDYQTKVRFPVNMFQQIDLHELAARARVV